MSPETTSLTEIGLGTLPIEFTSDGRVLLVDQRKLPLAEEIVDASDFKDMCSAIKTMVVRGAPSIGVAAAFGLAMKARELSSTTSSTDQFLEQLDQARVEIQSTRPTAVNLMWATDLLYGEAKGSTEAGKDSKETANLLIDCARRMLNEHIEINRKLSEYGQSLVVSNAKVLTHCNAGSLAACGWGTALGVIRSAKIEGKQPQVFVDETRPRSQGAKLTMWELMKDEIPSTLVCDNMAGHLMSTEGIDLVIVGADRIAANGDTANKIGTYSLAVLANYHNVPFYVAAPLSTIDPSIASGKEIPIEHREQQEVCVVNDRLITVDEARAFNPAFDVTPATLITAIITEAGILKPNYSQSIDRALKSRS